MERNIDMSNSEENENSKIKGLIMLGEKAKLLRIEKSLITNISIEYNGSVISMNGGKKARLELGNGVVLQSIYTSGGSAIHINAS
jgi:hypothetical protein